MKKVENHWSKCIIACLRETLQRRSLFEESCVRNQEAQFLWKYKYAISTHRLKLNVLCVYGVACCSIWIRFIPLGPIFKQSITFFNYMFLKRNPFTTKNQTQKCYHSYFGYYVGIISSKSNAVHVSQSLFSLLTISLFTWRISLWLFIC